MFLHDFALDAFSLKLITILLGDSESSNFTVSNIYFEMTPSGKQFGSEIPTTKHSMCSMV